MRMPSDDRDFHLTTGFDSPESRARIAAAGVIVALDPSQETRAVL